jgi:hypothetical protein
MGDNFTDLEKYFSNYNGKLSLDFYKRANEFGFDNLELFKLAIEFNMFVEDICFYKEEKQRHYQKKFSNKIFERDTKCIVTNRGIRVELEACHIVPVHGDKGGSGSKSGNKGGSGSGSGGESGGGGGGGDYTESNGLLLTRNLHKLYDDYLWSINPDTLCIDAISNNEEIVGSIVDYLGKKPNVKPDYFMRINLKSHWAKFLNKKNNFIKNQHRQQNII